ncbi:MAG: transglutaminase domain-containing protein [Firmicutes bacterium]|nr:transglutaminase domain-containing protein [Bacillota bacterium]
MNQKTKSALILLLVLCTILFCGCTEGGSEAPSSSDTSSAAASGPPRDNTPNVRVPKADGDISYGTNIVKIDASHTDQGYVMVRYSGSNPKVKLQIGTPDGNTYTYLLSQEKKYEAFPLSAGNGTYSLIVYENVSGDMYSTAFSQDITAEIKDEFLPFLYPNQYVWFTSDSKTVAKGSELVANAHSDLEAVEAIYDYVIKNISYDEAKASNVTYGYLPVVDETLNSGTGICFDYASLMAAMLRSQNIPTRLEVGYAGEAYHAWISTYLKEKGWVDGIIEFDGSSWTLMDPTFAASNSADALQEYIGDGTNYQLKYSY